MTPVSNGADGHAQADRDGGTFRGDGFGRRLLDAELGLDRPDHGRLRFAPRRTAVQPTARVGIQGAAAEAHLGLATAGRWRLDEYGRNAIITIFNRHTDPIDAIRPTGPASVGSSAFGIFEWLVPIGAIGEARLDIAKTQRAMTTPAQTYRSDRATYRDSYR
jgi:hypothetical protein